MKASPVALITGSSRGIGLAIAHRLANEGFRVVLNSIPGDPDLHAACAHLVSLGKIAVAIAGDVSDPTSIAKLFAQVPEQLGTINMVVHNAGYMSPAPFETEAIEAFDTTHRINVRGTFLVLTQALNHVEEGGRILVMSSSVVERPSVGYAAYLSSKAAIDGLTSVAAQEARRRNITVHGIAPGPIATDFFLRWKRPDELDAIARLSPFERLGTAEDVASLASFLASAEASWLHGENIRTNGGFA